MKKRIGLALLLAVLLLSGCAMQTVDQMYCLPRRSADYDNLQSAIDGAMTGLQYSAPTSGENQQTVQLVDLTGDGELEYLLFARANSDSPLRILIFHRDDRSYSLMTTIECLGSGFERVEYVDIDGEPGAELVVGRRVSEQVMGAVSVYSFSGGETRQLMSSNYSKFLCCDLDRNGRGELIILNSGEDEEDRGTAVLYSFRDGKLSRSREVDLSEPAACIKRIMVGSLYGGTPAVYVASSADGSSIVTDVFAMKDGVFSNISFSNESGTSVKTLRNYYVYADDIDDDGVLELPSLITMPSAKAGAAGDKPYLIRWFAMDLDGNEVDKMYTFHNFASGWYLELDDDLAARICVEEAGNACIFSIWEEDGVREVFRISALTGDDRDTAAVENNRFVLHRTDSVIYTGKLEGASASYGITEENLISSFRLIQQDWKTGET